MEENRQVVQAIPAIIMVLPGHIAGGYLATAAVLALAHPALPESQLLTLYVVGTLAGEAPDIDLLFFYFEWRSAKDDKKPSHRDYITHAPLVWLAACLIVSGIGLAFRGTFTEYLGLVILAGSWSHFILDSIECGVRWLRPFSDKRFCLRERPEAPVPERNGTLAHHWHYIRKYYVKNWTFYAEIVVTLVAIWMLLKQLS